MDLGVRFRNGHANRSTVNHFLSGLWNLVDDYSGLKWQIVTRGQQSNVQIRGVKFGLGVFVAQSFDRRNSRLGWSRLALLFYVQTERQEHDCRQDDIDNERYGRKDCD
jgi:hypothetical protein